MSNLHPPGAVDAIQISAPLYIQQIVHQWDCIIRKLQVANCFTSSSVEISMFSSVVLILLSYESVDGSVRARPFAPLLVSLISWILLGLAIMGWAPESRI